MKAKLLHVMAKAAAAAWGMVSLFTAIAIAQVVISFWPFMLNFPIPHSNFCVTLLTYFTIKIVSYAIIYPGKKMKGLKIGFMICVWFLFMFGSCFCKFVVVKNSLKVTSPENLKGTYECAIDKSSIPQCGGSLSGVSFILRLYNRKVCKSFADDFSFKTKIGGSLPVFLLADCMWW
ncbi:hypothetical protein L6452_41849 [Arctium lappa]|uniref:Uncharacterized protein n=1 Tax=Arctium lappa TaxID=4217 RepID=A0ACB8XHS7_ARCLA|nr:hypothetical protein L6452_41849 [Arctium lappa]